MITARDFIKIVPKSYKIDFYKEHGEYVYDSKINEDDEIVGFGVSGSRKKIIAYIKNDCYKKIEY